MRKFTKRIAAMLLALTLIIMMLPAGVMADEMTDSLPEDEIGYTADEVEEPAEPEEPEEPEVIEDSESITESESQSQSDETETASFETETEEETETETETKAKADGKDAKITKTVQIVWEDKDNADQVRPDSIEIQLCADGNEMPDKKVTLTKANAAAGNANVWEYTWKDLDQYAQDKETEAKETPADNTQEKVTEAGDTQNNDTQDKVSQEDEMQPESKTEITYSVKQIKAPLSYYLSVEKLYDDGREVFTLTHKNISNKIAIANTVTGSEKQTEQKETFKFVLEADPKRSTLPEGMKEMPMPEKSEGQKKEVSLEGAGNTEFPSMRFSDVGTFYYTVKEVKGENEDITYDDQVYTIRYTLKTIENKVDLGNEASLDDDQKKDVKNGLKKETTYKLDTKRGILNENGKNIKQIAFNNTYAEEEESESETEDLTTVSYKLSVKKSIKYKDDVKPDEATTFTFVLKPDPNNSKLEIADIPMPEGSDGESASVSITGEGTVGFDRINFAQPGTYYYTCSESYDKVDNYKYDGYDCTVVVEVTRDESENKLEISEAKVIKKDKKISERTASFSNGYGYGSGQTGPGKDGGSGGSGGSGGGSGAKTGDRTPVAAVMVMMIAALAVAIAAGMLVFRKKNN